MFELKNNPEVVSIRAEIDAIDAALTQTIQATASLLQRRATAARLLGRIKMDNHLSIRDPEREAEVREHVRRWAGVYGPLPPDQMETIFSKIIEACRRAQCGEVLL